MMPPPAITTSAVSMPVQAPHLEDQLQRGERRDVAIVERRRDLNDVEPDQLRFLRRRRQQPQGLPGGPPARGWDLGPRRKRRVENVDVEGDMDLLSLQRFGHLACGA